jgi:hypothetical protein
LTIARSSLTINSAPDGRMCCGRVGGIASAAFLLASEVSAISRQVGVRKVLVIESVMTRFNSKQLTSVVSTGVQIQLIH